MTNARKTKAKQIVAPTRHNTASYELASSDDETPLITGAQELGLNRQQEVAAYLAVTTDLTHAKIAERAGYSSGSGVTQFLNGQKGKQALRLASTEHVLQGAIIGLKTLISLAKSAKSENVRMLAAQDLVNRAQLSPVADKPQPNRQVSISINLTNADQPRVIEGTSVPADFSPSDDVQGGGGEKLSVLGDSDPSPSCILQGESGSISNLSYEGDDEDQA